MQWVKNFDHYASPDTIERAWANWSIAITKSAAGDTAETVHLLRESVLLARKLGDKDALVTIGGTYLWYCPSIREYVDEARQIADELTRMWDRVDPWRKFATRVFASHFFLSLGERKRAEEIKNELTELSSLTKIPAIWYVSPMMDICYQIIDGQLEEATISRDKIFRAGQEMGTPRTADTAAGFSYARLSGYLGWGTEALRRLDQWAKTTGSAVAPTARVIYLAYAGKKQEAKTILDEVVNQNTAGTVIIKGWFPTEALLLESAVLVGHTRAAELLLTGLYDTPYKTTGISQPTCVPRHLGGAAALLGRYDEARNYYDEAIKVCTEMRFRPELALTRLQLAELLLEHYPKEETKAAEHLDFAIKEFREMKMQPSLERALRHKEILKA
jgi:tetratricopeptide (TPR) repeat protein